MQSPSAIRTLPPIGSDHVSNPNGNITKLEALLSDLLDGNATDQQLNELEQVVQRDEAARQHYLKVLSTHALLKWSLAASIDAEEASTGNKGEPATSSQVVGIPPPIEAPMQTG